MRLEYTTSHPTPTNLSQTSWFLALERKEGLRSVRHSLVLPTPQNWTWTAPLPKMDMDGHPSLTFSAPNFDHKLGSGRDFPNQLWSLWKHASFYIKYVYLYPYNWMTALPFLSKFGHLFSILKYAWPHSWKCNVWGMCCDNKLWQCGLCMASM